MSLQKQYEGDDMEKVAHRHNMLAVAALLLAGLVATVAVLLTQAAGAAGNDQRVATAHNAKLGKTILVNTKGMTLYSLSAERNGKFICTTSFCLSLWKPLVVARGITPTGVKGLGVVMRPDHKRQVAYHGAPLYRFTQDRKPGDVNGNGFKDVGVWRPVTVGSSAQAASSSPPPNHGYGY
jgi:predicted lipoprotein with Yx(FWY)xxD motif